MKFHLNLLPFGLLLTLDLCGLLALSTTGTDLGVGGRLGPLSCCVRLHLLGGDLELDEGLETAKQPLLDELSQDDAKFAGCWINLAAELVSEGQDNLLEFKEDDFDTFNEDDVF